MTEIKIDDRLPEGLKLEVYVQPEDVRHQLQELGFGQMAHRFLMNAHDHAQEKPLETWLEWEGYWVGEEEDKKDFQTLLVLGVAHVKNLMHVRAMVVRHVPATQVEAARAGMFLMIDQYLDALRLAREGDQNN